MLAERLRTVGVVASGINRGANVGAVAPMSGTVGGAMLGAFYGVPAVAASLGPGRDFDYSARFVTSFVVTVAWMGGSHLRIAYEEVPGPDEGRTFSPRIGNETTAPEGTDAAAFMQDMITITPMQFDWTARSAIDELRAWGLSHKIAR